ncbi:hypothetical protein E8E11_009622 [Didymella keratinophila]|nr:hypothetical protein E8E11_009622 [Didymella keratinophila]
MSVSDGYNFVAGDEDLELHQLFNCTEADETVAVAPAPTADLLAPAPLGSPFAGPLEDLQGQVAGWLSPSAPGPVDGLDAFDFDGFLALNESIDDLPTPAEEAAAAPPPPELADSSTPQDKPAAASEPAGNLPAAAELDAVRDEIAQLKAALAAGGRQSSSSPRKRKLDRGEVSPPKRQITNEIGPIEALWSSKVTEDEERAAITNLAPQATPKPSSPQHDFTAPPSTPPINTANDDAISPENLRTLQQFLDDDPAFIYGATQQVNISTPPSDIDMGHLVNTKAKRAPPKPGPKCVPKNTSLTTNKVTKKAKTTPKKKTQHQRNASTTSNLTPSPASSSSHRTIDELLAANFYSLSAQEKLRLMLPMLRNLDPRDLEDKLAVLPCVQAKGTSHEVTVANAIRNSPPTVEDDDLLATKLTFGIPSSPTPAARRISSSPPAPAAPAVQASPLSNKVAHIEVCEDYGANRQRQAIEKAAALQAQGKQR